MLFGSIARPRAAATGSATGAVSYWLLLFPQMVKNRSESYQSLHSRSMMLGQRPRQSRTAWGGTRASFPANQPAIDGAVGPRHVENPTYLWLSCYPTKSDCSGVRLMFDLRVQKHYDRGSPAVCTPAAFRHAYLPTCASWTML